MKKIIPIFLIFLGLAFLIAGLFFFEDSASNIALAIFTFLLGLGGSIKGWIDLFKKDAPTYVHSEHIPKIKDGGEVIITVVPDDDSPDTLSINYNEIVKPTEDEMKNRAIEIAEISKKRKSFDKHKISIAHPKLLSKNFSSLILIQIYLPEMRRKVSQVLHQKFERNKVIEHIQDSELKAEQEFTIKLTSPEIIFSDSVTKKIDKGYLSTNFTAKPKTDCHPGNHQVILSICDNKTNFEYHSISFAVQITDYVFDHVSRPLLSNVTSMILGIGSMAMFILTLLGQIDSTFGLTSGTVAGALASAIYARFFSLYQYKVSSK